LVLLQPGWLWLLSPVLLFLIGYWRRPRWLPSFVDADGPSAGRLGVQLRHPLVDLLGKAAGSTTKTRSAVPLCGLIIVCLSVSLAEPVLQGKRLPDAPRERDVVFVVDTSIAMILRDYLLDGRRIDRMTLLKGVLDRMVQRLAGDRIGIIVFGEQAYTLVPLTRDQALLRGMLARIEPGIAGRFNALGEAIALAVKQTIAAPAGDDRQRRRILVVLSASGSPTGTIDARAAAELAAENGLPIYAIAVGAAGQAAEEARDTGLVYQAADLQRLQQLASLTGAQAFRAGNTEALEQVLRNIEQRESNRRDLPPRYLTRPLYQLPLLVGLLLLTLGALARSRRGWGKRHD
jgi:Ca-activated chloride channel family protein